MKRAALALLLAACTQDGLDAPATAAALDRAHFHCNVQPVLVARCGFFACHGSNQRPFHVFGVQRLRLDVGADDRDQPLTPAEEDANFESALGFAGDDRTPPLLLLKPLEPAAGGWFHRGKTLYGGLDVFETTDDVGYQLLADWIAGATADPACSERTGVGP